MTKKSAKRDLSCAYCGVTGVKITRDHVVPQAFWNGRALPPSMITVPACRKCQNELDRDATYFRNLVVSMCDPDDHPGIEPLAYGAVRRSIFRTNEDGVPILKDFNDLTRNARPDFRRSPSGLYTEPAIRLEVDIERFNRTPKKIIRGLFYHLTGERLPDEYEPRIYQGNGFWQLPRFNDTLAAMSDWESMGDDVFAIRRLRLLEDQNCTLWLMAFFKSVAIFGCTRPVRAPVEVA